MIAVLGSLPVAFILAGWLGELAFNVLLYLRSGSPRCGTGVLDVPARVAGCGTYDYRPVLAVILFIVLAVITIGYAYGVARWVSWPIRSMADTVESMGPNALAMRLPTNGPADESRRLTEAINALLGRVAEGYEAQRRFAANASHELRTPLATQRALIEVSLGSALSSDQLELLSRQLLATNERNERLIEGLLVLAETERGLANRVVVQLDQLAGYVVDTMRPTADERGIELFAELQSTAVVGESPLLERLIVNLVQNALKYNERGGWVQVGTHAAGRLSVVNTGPRVAPEQVDGLFEPFRRASGERLDHGNGAGLGLTIARSIVGAHDGVIGATANPDGGLTVRVQLPAR